MSPIPLTGTGGFFTRLGTMGQLVSAVNADRGNVIPGGIANVQQQFLSTNQDVIDNLYSYFLAYQNAGSGLGSNVRSMAASMLTEMANQSVSLSNNNTSTTVQLLVP